VVHLIGKTNRKKLKKEKTMQESFLRSINQSALESDIICLAMYFLA
jgi:hypothetical protein